MTNLKNFNPKRLNKVLRVFSDHKKLAFGLLIIERLVPHFDAFAQDTNLRCNHTLDEIREYSWNILKGLDINSFGKHSIIKCEELAKQIESSESTYTSAALDAVNACAYLLEFINDLNLEHIINIATLSYETATMIADTIEPGKPYNEKNEAEVLNHRLVQKELALQKEDLFFLENLDSEANEIWSQVTKFLNQRKTESEPK